MTHVQLEKLILRLAPFLTRPQRNNLLNFVLGLVIPIEKKRKTITAINDAIGTGKHQSSLNRFLTNPKWDYERVNDARIKTFVGARHGYCVIDDTLLEHFGMEMEGTDWFHDHNENMSVWSHNLVNVLHVTPERNIQPLYPYLYLKPNAAKEKNIPFRTKIEIACNAIQKASKVTNLLGVVVDSWYLSKKLIRHCSNLGIHWYSELKSNRSVWHPTGGWKQVRVFAREIPVNDFKMRRDLSNLPSLEYFSEKEVYLKGGIRIKLVILWNGKNGKDAEYKYLATDDIRIEGERFISLWRVRWCAEEFHRDAKQNLGLGEYQMRKIEGVVIHLLLVYLAYSILKWFIEHSAELFNTIITTIGEAGRKIKEILLYKLARRKRNLAKIKKQYSITNAVC